MKFKLLIVLFFTAISFSNAQSKQELEAKDFFGEQMMHIKMPMKYQINGKENLL